MSKVKISVALWVLLFNFLAATVFAITSEDSLELVHVFFRHGSRTPEEKDTYPNDPYTLEHFKPMGWGQLTNEGKNRAYKLGKMLRQRYDTFLGDIYTPEMVVATSTDFDRTKMTALLVLAGLFPPAPSQKWTEELSWIPIPYQFEKNEFDYFIRRPISYCPAYVDELERIYQSEEYQKELMAYADVLKYLEKHTGKPIRTLNNAFGVFQTLTAEYDMNMTLPEWTKLIFPEVVHNISAKQCQFENHNEILKRLNGGRMLKKVIENMIAKTANALSPAERKIYLYSGHENNVINILAALNVFEPHVPKYSAAAIFELHHFKVSKQYAVRVLYARDVDLEPEVQVIPGCETFCDFDDFLEITKPNVPLNYTAECRSDKYLG